MSAAKYDEVMKKLDAAGQSKPKGRSHHSTFGPEDRLMVYDVWDSQADFDAFRAGGRLDDRAEATLVRYLAGSLLMHERSSKDSHIDRQAKNNANARKNPGDLTEILPGGVLLDKVTE